MLFKFKQIVSARHNRRYIRTMTKLALTSIMLWIVMFIFYTYVYQLEFKKELDKVLNQKDPNNLLRVMHDSKLSYRIQLKPKNGLEFAKIIDAKSLQFYKRIQRPSYEINCQKLIEWEESEVRKSKRALFKLKSLNNMDDYVADAGSNATSDSQQLMSMSIPMLPDSNFVFEKSMCKLFRELRGYDSYIIHPFEYTFPIAFTILTYNNVEQLERLLRSVYRPQNVYCIHIDSKSSKTFHQAVKSITDCFDNVFIATELEHIVYAGFNRLKADLNCMHDFLFPNLSHANLAGKNLSVNWKYLINLASTEFPLRTNYEMTRILQMFNGANDIEVMNKFQRERVEYSWVVKKRSSPLKEYLIRTKRLKTPVPHNYTIVKGLAYCLFSAKFVKYVLTNQYAIELLKWSHDTYSPDEW
jgi:hypothetical protein